MRLTPISFPFFKERTKSQEGIVLLGCGGDHQQWIDGITDYLKNEKIAIENPWDKVYLLTTSGGRYDIAFVFKMPYTFDMNKMVLWRMTWGDCSWISDYLVNYKKQF